MNSDEFIEIVSNITYKPGFHLEAFPSELTGGVRVQMWLNTDDADNPGRKINIHDEKEIGIYQLNWFTQTRALAWIQNYIHDWETHEADEWLRFKGERLREPH